MLFRWHGGRVFCHKHWLKAALRHGWLALCFPSHGCHQSHHKCPCTVSGHRPSTRCQGESYAMHPSLDISSMESTMLRRMLLLRLMVLLRLSFFSVNFSKKASPTSAVKHTGVQCLVIALHPSARHQACFEVPQVTRCNEFCNSCHQAL